MGTVIAFPRQSPAASMFDEGDLPGTGSGPDDNGDNGGDWRHRYTRNEPEHPDTADEWRFWRGLALALAVSSLVWAALFTVAFAFVALDVPAQVRCPAGEECPVAP